MLSNSKHSGSKFNFLSIQSRHKRVAPGLVIPQYQFEPTTEVRDLLATAAFDTQRSWSWIKDYRRLLLAGGRFRYTHQLPEFLKTEEWSSMSHDQIVKQRIEELVHTAFNPIPKPKIQKAEKTAEEKAKNKLKNSAKPKKAASKPVVKK